MCSYCVKCVTLLKVLDRLILYLRIVHSFDFYTAVEYPSEDEMPHRCGIMHARAPPPKIVTESEGKGKKHSEISSLFTYLDGYVEKCYIMHVEIGFSFFYFSTVTEHNSLFENKVKAFLNMKSTLSQEEAQRLGKKSEESEIEKFIAANTQELAKDKWLCPLSGKKFKGPEFIRKHIIMKHQDKVDEVKLEVDTSYISN